MTPGKIVITENKVKFEYHELEKPKQEDYYVWDNFHKVYWDEAMKAYKASKRVIMVSNWIKIDAKRKKCQLLMTKMRIAGEFIPNRKSCEAEIVNNKAVIIKIN